MRRITDVVLTNEISQFTSLKTVAQDKPFFIDTYRKLVEQIAKLSFLNKDYVLFFRGQKIDHKDNKSNKSIFYPTIYREELLEQDELKYKFERLDMASKFLTDFLHKENIIGYDEVKRKRIIQWALLQHYEVVYTPLIDVTQSLRVACSFATHKNTTEKAFIYVFGLPYYTNRISINSEHDLVNVRLLSICPPDALRPYFQEGFLVGTSDVTYEYEDKSELDLNRRLIAKFEIPNSKNFWGNNFQKIPYSALYPKKDKIKNICDEVKKALDSSMSTPTDNSIGAFLKLWVDIESTIIKIARNIKPEIYNIRSALIILKQKENNFAILHEIDLARLFRNKLFHKPTSVTNENLKNMIENLKAIKKAINTLN